MTNSTIAVMGKTKYGCTAKDLRTRALDPTPDGARAALETFYYAFNQRSLTVFDNIWAPDPLIQLNNPLGGIQRGQVTIRELYRGIFEGPAQVWVEFFDIVEYLDQTVAVFAGREHGEFTLGNVTVPLKIRTTRIFKYLGQELGWRQVHHHGSIDDAEMLRRYQMAVKGGLATHHQHLFTCAQVEVKPEKVAAFIEATQQLIDESRKEAGVIVFDFYRSTESDNSFIFFEIFESGEALEIHRAASHTQTWFSEAMDFLIGEPAIHHLRPLD